MARVDAAQAIRNAIEAERAAAKFYALLADSTDDAEARAFLEDLVRQETSHATSIEKAAQSLKVGELPEHATGKVEAVETLPEWRFVDGISLDQALEVAISAERQASLFYDAFADSLPGEVGDFFRDLSRQEQEHEQLLLERRKKMAGASRTK